MSSCGRDAARPTSITIGSIAAFGSPRFTAEGRCWGLAGCGFSQRLLGDRNPVIGRREARWLWRWSYYRQMAIESRRPRQYERFGLEKLVVSSPLEAVFAQRKPRAA